MYLAGVSVRRVEDITEALRGSKVSPTTISELNKKAYSHIVHFHRDAFTVAKMLKAIHAQESKAASRNKAKSVVSAFHVLRTQSLCSHPAFFIQIIDVTRLRECDNKIDDRNNSINLDWPKCSIGKDVCLIHHLRDDNR